ncbi:MAG TPA: glycosyltransferase, partial [Spirochaetota bacterium]|nr:glycosyltransferase [Spirochaetota bacterium]
MNTNPAWGGGEKWHLQTALALRQRGYKVFFIARPASPLALQVKANGLPLEELRIGNLSFLNPFKNHLLRQWFKQNKIEAVFLNNMTDLYSGAKTAKQAGVRRTIFRRGLDVPVNNNLVNRHAFRYADLVVPISRACLDNMLLQNPAMFSREKVKIISIGLDLKAFDRVTPRPVRGEQQELVIGNAGRLCSQKAQTHLVDLACELKKTTAAFKILIAGTGPERRNLEQYAEKKKVSDKVVFLGFVKKIQDLLAAVDIFVLTS